MTRKLEIPDVDNLISRYQAGEPVKELLGQRNVSQTTFYRLLNSRGIPRCQLRKPLPEAEIISRYLAGESELSLARAFNIARNAIRRRLIEVRIKPRSGSEANIIRISKMSPQERHEITSSAHIAVRGRRKTTSEKLRHARTVEAKGLHISTVESILADMLRERGINNFIQQKAIGIYNVDIAIKRPRLAVEVFGGNWHTSQHHILLHNERIPYILNRSWNVLIIWVNARRYPLTVKAADYAISMLEELRLDKSIRGQYRVIRGDGEFMTFPGNQLDGFTGIESTTGAN